MVAQGAAAAQVNPSGVATATTTLLTGFGLFVPKNCTCWTRPLCTAFTCTTGKGQSVRGGVRWGPGHVIGAFRGKINEESDNNVSRGVRSVQQKKLERRDEHSLVSSHRNSNAWKHDT